MRRALVQAQIEEMAYSHAEVDPQPPMNTCQMLEMACRTSISGGLLK